MPTLVRIRFSKASWRLLGAALSRPQRSSELLSTGVGVAQHLMVLINRRCNWRSVTYGDFVIALPEALTF